MAGQRTSLASLAGGKVEDVPGRGDPTLVHLALAKVAPTPLNPREDFGTADELLELGQSMARRQLAPIVVVSRPSYVKLFPEHTEQVQEATYVIANGERRYRAAAEAGLKLIECVIREQVADSRADFLDAVLSENIDRKNFDPIEEARAIEAMVKEFGSARAVAEHRGKHETWVSQRRSLLRLAPSVQEMVRARKGDKKMPVETARKLAKAIKDQGLDERGQLDWWEAEQGRPKPERRPAASPPVAPSPRPEQSAAAVLEPENLTAVKSAPPVSSVPQQVHPRPDEHRTAPDPAVSVPPTESLTPEPRPAAASVAVADVPWNDPQVMRDLLLERMEQDNRRKLARMLAAKDGF